MTNLPTIPAAEYPQRTERLRALMHRKGLEAVLLGTGPNLTYFSGYPSPSRSGSRPFFLILPLMGEPILIVQSGRKEEAVRYAHVQDVRDYAELSRVPVDMIRGALHERGARAVGLELGLEQSFDVPYLEFCRLREGLANTRLVDASDILWQARMIKSENEIACLRAACAILTDAYLAAFASARGGMTERQIANIIFAHCDQAEAGDRFLVMTSGQGNYDLPSKPPEARLVQAGDMVWFDAGCTVSGYWSDFSRAGVVGEPSAQQIAAQEAIHQITGEAVRRIRPGILASSIARFCNQKVAELDFPITQDISGRAARCGHGVGLNLTELPHISESDHTVLEPGMVIAIEPAVATEYGTFHIEENVLVTQDGYEVLSQAPYHLRHIART
ncbi:MAG: Xaa-Pro peptidase family protein [Verrucomicrobiales bacterium]|nr:Xaa-Pro peptidase family protein [Verrucomicrobiales bacterium]